jgi:hypothetical protein
MNEAEFELAGLLGLPRDRYKNSKEFLKAALRAAKEEKFEVVERRDPESKQLLMIEVWHGARQLDIREPATDAEIPSAMLVGLIAAIRKHRRLPP